MSKLKELYNNHKDKSASYNEWLHSEFEAFIDENLSNYERCLIYNEMAQDKLYSMWENINDISEIYGSDFLHVYSLIDHNKFNIYDDVIIEEYCLIVSYTYGDFLNEYWYIDDIVEYIDKKGLENLINKNLILDKVNVM